MFHGGHVAIPATDASRTLLPIRQLTCVSQFDTIAGMAKARKPLQKKEKALDAPPGSFCLGQWLAKLGISDEQFSELVGVTRETVWKWVVGARQPRKAMIQKVADKLGLEPADLWRSPGGLISLDAAASHIKDNNVRQVLVSLIKTYPPS